MIELPKRARPATNADINIVPYIDVMLVLLVIFMMTTPIIEQGMEVNLPEGPATMLDYSDGPQPTVITVDGENRYYINSLLDVGIEEVGDIDQQLDEVLIPGEVLINMSDEIEINLDRNRIRISVANHGDRPIQVGSHYHFYETNSALYFDREKTKGFRLNIPSGTAVRFEPGQERKVELVEYDGKKVVYGFNAKVMGKL